MQTEIYSPTAMQESDREVTSCANSLDQDLELLGARLDRQLRQAERQYKNLLTQPDLFGSDGRQQVAIDCDNQWNEVKQQSHTLLRWNRRANTYNQEIEIERSAVLIRKLYVLLRKIRTLTEKGIV